MNKASRGAVEWVGAMRSVGDLVLGMTLYLAGWLIEQK